MARVEKENTERHKPVLWRVVTNVAFLFFALVLTILVEWIGMSTLWEQEGVNHSRRLLVNEARNLNLNVVENAPGGDAVKANAVSFSNGFFALVADKTHMADGLQHVQDSRALKALAQTLTLPPPHEYSVAALNMVQLFGLKLVVVTLAMPIYLVFAIWGVGEGLTLRALRRYRAAHESAYVFHHAKMLVWPMIALPVIAYLAVPVSVSPVAVFGPCALIYGAAWVVMVSKFKKYL